MERRLTTILAADVVGYSRLMGVDEAGTLAALKSHREELFDPKAAQYRCRTVKLMGDGALMEFVSVVDAVSFAVEVQVAMAARNEGVAEDQRIVFRIGINIGDIIVEGDDIYGDGVNVAARLEGLAEPSGICISESVHGQVRGKLDLTFDPMGAQEVKNIAEPVSVYRVVMDEKAAALVTAVQASAPARKTWPALVAAGVALLAVLGSLAWWQTWMSAPRIETAAVPVTELPTLVVLPFDNMSGDADLGYFSDGMTEDIITELSKYPELKVVSRNTSFTYRGKAVSARQISEELGVRYVLEGSVRKQGDKVRITAQLIDGATDAHVWAERFDDEGTDIFALQDRITAKIATTLSGGEGRIKKAEYKRAWETDAAKLEEYDYYLRGHSIFYQFTPEAMLKAREIWREGLEKFPESGLLRIKIGWTYYHIFRMGWTGEPKRELDRAYELALKGLADQSLPRVGQWAGHFLIALVQLFRNRDHDRALEEAMITLKIVPNDTETLIVLSWIPVYSGKPDLALEWVERAFDREVQVPLWYYQHMGQAYSSQGNCEKAVEAFDKVTWVNLFKSAALAECYAELDRLDDAKAEIARLREAYPDLTVSKIGLWLPYKDRGFRDRVQAALIEAGLPE